MKNSLSCIALAALLGFCGLAPAQPDLNNAKGENPANRDRQRAAERQAQKQAQGGLLKQRGTKRVELRLERLPRALTLLGVTDTQTQDAIKAHFLAAHKAQEPVLDARQKLRRSLILKTSSDAQIKAATNAQREAQKDYHAAFEKTLDELDKKIGFRKNARLEAALLTLGALDAEAINAAF